MAPRLPPPAPHDHVGAIGGVCSRTGTTTYAPQCATRGFGRHARGASSLGRAVALALRHDALKPELLHGRPEGGGPRGDKVLRPHRTPSCSPLALRPVTGLTRRMTLRARVVRTLRRVARTEVRIGERGARDSEPEDCERESDRPTHDTSFPFWDCGFHFPGDQERAAATPIRNLVDVPLRLKPGRLNSQPFDEARRSEPARVLLARLEAMKPAAS